MERPSVFAQIREKITWRLNAAAMSEIGRSDLRPRYCSTPRSITTKKWGRFGRPREKRSIRKFCSYLPVPCKATDCGLPGALSVKFSDPVRSPVCVGVKFTFTMQLFPAASVDLHAAFDVSGTNAKSPVVAMLLKVSVEAPEFKTVTFLAPDVTPTRTLPHVKEVGVRVTTGPVAVTVRVTVVVWVNDPDVPVMVTVDVPVGVPEGTVRVKVLVVVAGFGEKPAVTPFGRPDAFKLTLPEKPLVGVIVMVLVPLLPCPMVRELGLALRLKSG